MPKGEVPDPGLRRYNPAIVLTRLTGLLTAATLLLACPNGARAQVRLIGDPVDVSEDFTKPENVYFVAGRVTEIDAASGTGKIEWKRHRRRVSLDFNHSGFGFTPDTSNEFPPDYAQHPVTPFSIEFVNARTIRFRMATRDLTAPPEASLMLAGEVPRDTTWKVEEESGSVTWRSPSGSVTLIKDPWRIEIRDAAGRLLTSTQTLNDLKSYSSPVPFSFVRRASDASRRMAAVFSLSPDEKLFGTGESFTRLDKRGQKAILFIRDGLGAQTGRMYKPIPFVLSSRDYGMFVHTTAPLTLDMGHGYDQSHVIYSADDNLDLFVFLGDPKTVLTDYTAITGRSPMPPLWSFGFWMSRITYKSEDEVRDVASKLREHRIPSDVIHIDTGWFEQDWRADYKFSTTRFKDPAKMMADLKGQGFRVSLWQLPYFTPGNPLYKIAAERGYAVPNAAGRRPSEDVVLDFSKPETVTWYQGLIAGLLKLGVAAIKVDFGEDAPLDGVYASGRTGLFEHNLYPLRYNKIVAEITKQITGEWIIWARSAWAGSQRYPLHWGGDAETTNSGMAGTLRGGLSFGLSGFTFWSHDIGGFVEKTPRELYSRWLPFGALTSHTRAHGQAPKEPWHYDAAFVDEYRRSIDLRYALMPYIYAQARSSSERGHPMMRTLFFEFPDDPASWLIEDQYMFGSDLLVAPLFESGAGRRVYLPPGAWIDYQGGAKYEGGRWHTIKTGVLPVVLLVRGGAIVPHAAVAQHTGAIDWKTIELRVYGGTAAGARGLFALPDGDLHTLTAVQTGRGFALREDPLKGRVTWQVRSAAAR
jgi:alpha-D-xyloside xylohydrolase